MTPVATGRNSVAPDRVDRPGRRDDVAGPALGDLQQPVEVPVAALALGQRVAGRRRLVALVAGDPADLGVGEPPDEGADGVGGEHAVRIGEDEDLAGRRGHGRVEGIGLADPRQVEELARPARPSAATIAAVASSEPSEAMTTSRRSRG